MSLYEVSVEANEPWTVGQRRAYDEAILDFVESNLSESERTEYVGTDIFDTDAQLTNYFAAEVNEQSGYLGIGSNAHDDADGPVFRSADDAQRLADTFRTHLRNLGASVRVFTLADQADDE